MFSELASPNKTIFISLGNSCAAALAIRNLKLSVSQPYDAPSYIFDWCPTTLGIVRDVIENGPSKFLDFSTEFSLEALGDSKFDPPEEMIDFILHDSKGFLQTKREDDITNTNLYGVWFPHDRHIKINQLQEQLKRRSDRLFEVLRNKDDKEVCFVFTNETSIVLELYKINETKYYKEIIDLVKYIEKKYPSLKFRLLCFFANNIENDIAIMHMRQAKIKYINITCKDIDEFRHKVSEYLLNFYINSTISI